MSGEGFLGRWSRRKREALRGVEEPATEALAPVEAAPEAALPAFDPASLPPLESLTEASDFTAFLRAEVPSALRQAALRRAWRLDPAIRDFTGPADYAWDYNAPDGVPGFAHTLGGDVKRLLAQAIGALEEIATEEPSAEAPSGEAPVAILDAGELEPIAAEVEAPARLMAEAEEPPPEPQLPRRRHGGAMPA